METIETTTQPTAEGLPSASTSQPGVVASGPHPYSRSCRDAGCEACRKYSKAKRASNLRYRGKGDAPRVETAQPVSAPGPSLPGVLPAPGPLPPSPPSRPVVPWTGDLVRPLVTTAIKLLEKWDKAALVEEARAVSPQVAAFIAARADWDPPAKEALQSSSEVLAVKWLNAAGISSEFSAEMTFCLAVLAISSRRSDVVEELRKQAAEAKEEKAKAKEQREAA